jgi:hypothetical protein
MVSSLSAYFCFLVSQQLSGVYTKVGSFWNVLAGEHTYTATLQPLHQAPMGRAYPSLYSQFSGYLFYIYDPVGLPKACDLVQVLSALTKLTRLLQYSAHEHASLHSKIGKANS